jgi:hypothetical protein
LATAFRIGDRSAVGAGSFIGGQGGVSIGDDVIMGAGVRIFSENHEYQALDRPIRAQGETRRGVAIDDDCWIGAGTTIVDGVSVGTGCVIAAGAVVTRSVPPFTIAAGVPARAIGSRQAARATVAPPPETAPAFFPAQALPLHAQNAPRRPVSSHGKPSEKPVVARKVISKVTVADVRASVRVAMSGSAARTPSSGANTVHHDRRQHANPESEPDDASVVQREDKVVADPEVLPSGELREITSLREERREGERSPSQHRMRERLLQRERVHHQTERRRL